MTDAEAREIVKHLDTLASHARTLAEIYTEASVTVAKMAAR